MKLGKAFSDSVIIEHKVARRLTKDPTTSWWMGKGRALLFTTGFFVALFILLWRLFELTAIQGHRFRVLADGNRTRELIRHAPRGNLLDRTGKPLTVNILEYRLAKPCEVTRSGKNGDQDLCTQYISEKEGEQLAREGLPDSWFLEPSYRRQYPYGESLAHVVGYVGELSSKELADDYYILRNYHSGDRIGRMGAEAVYEDLLRGRDGRELVEVDAKGKILRSLGRQEEIPGEDVSLSLDANIAAAVSHAFPADAKGAVVVSKPMTGEMLALYSSPSFSSDAFSFGLSVAQYQKLVDDPDKPMFNRAIGGVYPPGSTFKIVTAIAALEEKVVTAATTVDDIGVITIGPFSFPNWYFTQYGKTEGVINIVRAIERSNDIFFYKAGEWLGITKLANWAHRVGIGKPLGIEVPGEAGGLMPDPTWKNIHFSTKEDLITHNNEWYLGDTYHVAIGQGYLLTTPLQVNAWTNVIANAGRLCKPTIKKALSDKREMKSNCKDLNIKRETIDLVTEGMREACSPGGTGYPLFNFQIISADNQTKKNIPIACKTGTAEFGDPNNHTHAWFTAFAPVPKSVSEGEVLTGEPEISVTVLVEGAGEGSTVAAPIAKKILEEWFGR